jgi:hypothetical protein
MKPVSAKITFTADIASFYMDKIHYGNLLKYLTDALRENSNREYDFIFENAELRIEEVSR